MAIAPTTPMLFPVSLRSICEPQMISSAMDESLLQHSQRSVELQPSRDGDHAFVSDITMRQTIPNANDP